MVISLLVAAFSYSCLHMTLFRHFLSNTCTVFILHKSHKNRYCIISQLLLPHWCWYLTIAQSLLLSNILIVADEFCLIWWRFADDGACCWWYEVLFALCWMTTHQYRVCRLVWPFTAVCKHVNHSQQHYFNHCSCNYRRRHWWPHKRTNVMHLRFHFSNKCTFYCNTTQTRIRIKFKVKIYCYFCCTTIKTFSFRRKFNRAPQFNKISATFRMSIH